MSNAAGVPMSRLRAAALILLFCLFAPVRDTEAAEVPVDLELVLLVDVSGSVDAQEAELQRRGYAAAIADKRVVEAIAGGPLGRIAVTYVEWADDTYQNVVVGWTVIDGPAAAQSFAERLVAAPINTAFWTSIGAALDFAVRHLEGNGFAGVRKVVDISGDGYSNRGRPPGEARDAAVKAGVVINGLPILNTRPNPWGGMPPNDLDAYYERHVIGGPGAFVQVARDFNSFGQAILSKLVREIALAPEAAPRTTGHAALASRP